MDNTLWGHLDELRRTLIRCFCIIALGMAASLFFYQDIFSVLTSPLHNTSVLFPGKDLIQHQNIKRQRLYNSGPDSSTIALPSDAIVTSIASSTGTKQLTSHSFEVPSRGFVDFDLVNRDSQLVIFGPIDGMTITLKICLWIGLVGTSPIWIYFILQFITPALRREERAMVLPFLGLSLLFMSTGFLFAFFITIPIANQYLQAFNSSIAQNLWGLSHYIDYTLVLVLANGLAFELCVILLFLVHHGMLSASAMASKRRHMIIGAFILGALLTPPDVLTQFMMAIPLIMLYEAAIVYARFRERSLI